MAEDEPEDRKDRTPNWVFPFQLCPPPQLPTHVEISLEDAQRYIAARYPSLGWTMPFAGYAEEEGGEE